MRNVFQNLAAPKY